jgi:hypothetical protein
VVGDARQGFRKTIEIDPPQRPVVVTADLEVHHAVVRSRIRQAGDRGDLHQFGGSSRSPSGAQPNH